MAKKPESSRVPSVVGAIPVVGDLMKQADSQAQWMQELLEQNARLMAQLPATIKSFNDSLERFNQTVGQLDRAVSRIEGVSKSLTGPVERLANSLDPKALREIPEVLDQLRREALPALRAATDTQNQVARLQSTVERIVALLSELPGAGLLRRLGQTRPEAGPSTEADTPT